MEKGLIKEAFRLQTLAGLSPINEAGKDYDGDGEVESPEDEYKGSVDKAIKTNTKKEGMQTQPGSVDFTHGHDHEGSMAVAELKSLQANSSKLINLIGQNAELPGWVSTYISLAADYMNSVSDYLSNEADQMNNEY